MTNDLESSAFEKMVAEAIYTEMGKQTMPPSCGFDCKKLAQAAIAAVNADDDWIVSVEEAARYLTTYIANSRRCDYMLPPLVGEERIISDPLYIEITCAIGTMLDDGYRITKKTPSRVGQTEQES